jgi:hypothetical protein
MYDCDDITNLHELSHLVQDMFVGTGSVDRWLSEGIAEAFPYYLLDYEERDEAHRKLIADLSADDIFNARILACKFDELADYSVRKRAQERSNYISSYLLVRGILGKIEKKLVCGRVAAMKEFLMFLRKADNQKYFLIWDIANFIGMPSEELENEKSLQLAERKAIAEIADKLAERQQGLPPGFAR